ncbi:MAG: 1,4-alpha-glucan branching enzyme, partial [Lentisphaeria bacterium]|nr:1,4-alpha-glucan branching enzyme [Lentisphaeria bacterium]
MRQPVSGFIADSTISHEEILKIIESRHHDPFQVLGRHPYTKPGKSKGQRTQHWVVRVFIPDAVQVRVMRMKKQIGELNQIHRSGFFEGIFTPQKLPDTKYQLAITYNDGNEEVISDPYTTLPVITEYDLYLWGQGNHYHVYEKLGSHPLTVDGQTGYYFAVWAPSAQRVSVVGAFNQWDGRRHPMRVMGSSGVWELFIPGIESGTLYKFEIRTSAGMVILKTDPMANKTELRPNTASITTNLDNYQWKDEKWMADRSGLPDNRDTRYSIYEVHLGSWRRGEHGEFLNYRDLAHQLVAHCQDLGFSHIELLPVNEHP